MGFKLEANWVSFRDLRSTFCRVLLLNYRNLVSLKLYCRVLNVYQNLSLICKTNSNCFYLWLVLPGRNGNRSDRPASVGSRVFNRPVKPDEKPVKFSFLATKILPNTNRNTHTDMYFLNKSFMKNGINKSVKSHLLKTKICCLFSTVRLAYLLA